MNADFHYYATYCAAALAGYSHAEALEICYSANLVDHCTQALLTKVHGPAAAATTQMQSELIDARTDIIGLQNITRIWASFHFLPRDLYAEINYGSKNYRQKYRLICGPNGDLLVKTVQLAKDKNLQAVGVAMHILADTWAHTYFAGTPSLVMNNSEGFFELIPDGETLKRHPIVFGHNPVTVDNVEKESYTASVHQSSENSIMNLGHGRAGHLPDYSFIRYIFMPAWGDYNEILKDNPHDYLQAFAQMVYAMQYLHGDLTEFKSDTYAMDTIAPWLDEINHILEARRTSDAEDWKALGEKITGETIPPFDLTAYQKEYTEASKEEKDSTFLGRFFKAAIAQKGMVTSEIYSSGSRLAGRAVEKHRKKGEQA